MARDWPLTVASATDPHLLIDEASMMTRRPGALVARAIAGTAFAVLLALLCQSKLSATESVNLVNAPGPHGGVRLADNYFYIYARNTSTGGLQVRRTNGVTSESDATTSWTQLPAISTATFPTAVAVCSNAAVPVPQKVNVYAVDHGQVKVTQSTNGKTGFSAWTDVQWSSTDKMETDRSVAAVWFRPTTKAGVVDTTKGGVCLFYVHLLRPEGGTTGPIVGYQLRMTWSANGLTGWSAPTFWGSWDPAAAPTAVVETNVLNDPTWLYSVKAVYKTDQANAQNFFALNTLRSYTLDPPTEQLSLALPMKGPAWQVDPTIISTMGACVNESDPTSWSGYHLPKVREMRASVMKFNMTTQRSWNPLLPPALEMRYSHIFDCVQTGLVKTVILRTGDAPYNSGQLTDFINTMAFPDNPNKYIKNLPLDFPSVRWIIENGNEPDRIRNPNLSAADARALAMNGIMIRNAFPKFKFMISMPTVVDSANSGLHNFDYLKAFAAVGSDGKSVLTEYDGAGVHAYCEENLHWMNTAEVPFAVRDFVLARQPYGKFIHMTELGLNSKLISWSLKAGRYRAAALAMPANVEGHEIFCLSAHPDWNTFVHYCLDKSYSDLKVTSVTPNGNFTRITLGPQAGTTPTTRSFPAGTLVQIRNLSLWQPPLVNEIFLDGKYVVTNPPPPAPPSGVGMFWIQKNTVGMPAMHPTKIGYADSYPLTTNGAGAELIGNR